MTKQMRQEWTIQTFAIIFTLAGLYHRSWFLVVAGLAFQGLNSISREGLFCRWITWIQVVTKYPNASRLAKWPATLLVTLSSVMVILAYGAAAGVVGGVIDNVQYRDWFSIANWIVFGTPLAFMFAWSAIPIFSLSSPLPDWLESSPMLPEKQSNIPAMPKVKPERLQHNHAEDAIEKVRKLVTPGVWDMRDSPKSMIANIEAILNSYDHLKDPE